MRLVMLPLAAIFCLARAGAAPAQATLRYEFDPAQSRLYVVTHRTGLLSFLGHEHAILVRRWSGFVCTAQSTPMDGYGALVADARSLEIDTDSARALAGLGGGPSERQLRTIRAKLVDSEHLAIERYPEIRLDSLVVMQRANDQWLADGMLTIRGVAKPVRIPFTIASPDSAALRFTGNITIRQSHFGLKPESIAGVVRVSDPVDIHFDLTAKAASQSCN
ncbi:MAG TPA: YceI family protein [Longimicrobiales bacterium]